MGMARPSLMKKSFLCLTASLAMLSAGSLLPRSVRGARATERFSQHRPPVHRQRPGLLSRVAAASQRRQLLRQHEFHGGNGSIFKVTPDGVLTILLRFNYSVDGQLAR